MIRQQLRLEATWYYNLSLDRLVPKDHLLRLIANAVDFSFIQPLCRPFCERRCSFSLTSAACLKRRARQHEAGL